MISSDRMRWLGCCVGAAVLLVVPWTLGCGVSGDIGTMGCPVGEVCAPAADLRFSRATASCPSEDGVYEAVFDGAVRGTGETAVALGGTTWARVEAGSGRVARFSSEFEPLSMDEHGGTVRAVQEGAGRFEIRAMGDPRLEDGVLIDYLAIPVVAAARVAVLDNVACPGEDAALLRGVPVRLRAMPIAADGRPLVDTSASVRTLAGEDVITPRFGERATLRVLAGSVEETTVTLPIADAADEIIARTGLVAQLRGEVTLGYLGDVCFQARAGGATLLGVPITAARATGRFRTVGWPETAPETAERLATQFPSCVFLERDPMNAAEPGVLEIEMAGLTARFTVAD